jgi:hypothetical protein
MAAFVRELSQGNGTPLPDLIIYRGVTARLQSQDDAGSRGSSGQVSWIQDRSANTDSLVRFLLVFALVVIALVGVSLFPVRETDQPRFATPAFQSVWQTYSATAARPLDLWGSEPLNWRVEPYFGAPDNRRTVQYFERGRMEIETGTARVTHGLLARELVGGRIDLGGGLFEERTPPEISIDSGSPNDQVPTYLALSRVVADPQLSVPGQRVTAWIDRSGRIERTTTPAVVRYGDEIEQTGIKLPDVTTELFQQSEFTGGRWVELFGFPISQAVWTYYRRDDELRPSLVQVFERRILVYTPGMEPDRRFTVVNTGRHYYRWRYGSELMTDPPPLSLENVSTAISVPEGYHPLIYADGIGTPIDMALAPSGHLLVLTLEGQILRSAAMDPDDRSAGFIVWADGIEDPVGLRVDGGGVHVETTSDDLLLSDSNGRAELAFGGNRVAERVDEPRGQALDDPQGREYLLADESGVALLDAESGDVLVPLDDVLDDAGPALMLTSGLYVTGTALNGRSVLVHVPARQIYGPSTGLESIVSFPAGTSVQAIASTSRTRWPNVDNRSMFVGVESDTGGSLYLLSFDATSSSAELLEFGAGFGRPSSMVFGLDGSLYVADAARGLIIRVVYDPS